MKKRGGGYLARRVAVEKAAAQVLPARMAAQEEAVEAVAGAQGMARHPRVRLNHLPEDLLRSRKVNGNSSIMSTHPDPAQMQDSAVPSSLLAKPKSFDSLERLMRVVEQALDLHSEAARAA